MKIYTIFKKSAWQDGLFNKLCWDNTDHLGKRHWFSILFFTKKEKKNSRWTENHECSRRTPECLKITLEWEKQKVFVMEFLIQICPKYSTGLTYTKKLLIVYQKLKFNWVKFFSSLHLATLISKTWYIETIEKIWMIQL